MIVLEAGRKGQVRSRESPSLLQKTALTAAFDCVSGRFASQLESLAASRRSKKQFVAQKTTENKKDLSFCLQGPI